MNVPTFDDETHCLLKSIVTDFDSVGTEVVSAISNFNWLWPMVEAKCFYRQANRDFIKVFFTDEIADEVTSQASFAAAFLHFSKRYSKNPDATLQLSTLLNGRDKLHEDICTGLRDGSNEAEKATALALICFRLRNNLFHGTKGEVGFSDQGENFFHANSYLKILLNSQAH